MKRRKMKVFALVMAMVLPLFAFAQKSDGFFKVNDDYYNRGVVSGGTFGLGGMNNITPSAGGMGLGGMNNETPGGMSLGGMIQEDPIPLGNGLLILAAIGVGYAAHKRKQH